MSVAQKRQWNWCQELGAKVIHVHTLKEKVYGFSQQGLVSEREMGKYKGPAEDRAAEKAKILKIGLLEPKKPKGVSETFASVFNGGVKLLLSCSPYSNC